MNRKLVVSILAIILVITMVLSLVLTVIPTSMADGYEKAQACCRAETAVCTDF